MVKNTDGTETIYYCECGQAVRLRRRDNTWVHYGYKRMHEPYSDFLDRTNHLVKNITSKVWGKSVLSILK